MRTATAAGAAGESPPTGAPLARQRLLPQQAHRARPVLHSRARTEGSASLQRVPTIDLATETRRSSSSAAAHPHPGERIPDPFLEHFARRPHHLTAAGSAL
jgi:hypothetical protein